MFSILFDLDGTLIDSAPDLRNAINAALNHEGAAPLTLPETIGFIGNGMPHLVKLAREARGLPETLQDRMLITMRDAYLAADPGESVLYPHVPEMLAALRAEGYKLGLCTNKLGVATTAVLRDFDLARHFDAVVSGDSYPQRKPDPLPLLRCAESLGVPPLLFIGDSEVDRSTARAARIPFALFLRGYRKQTPAELAPEYTFDDYRELPALLAAARSTRA